MKIVKFFLFLNLFNFNKAHSNPKHEAVEKTQESFLQCVRDICGTEEKLDNYIELSNKLSFEQVPADIRLRISDQYDKLALLLVKPNAPNVKAYRKLLNDGKIPDQTGQEDLEKLMTLFHFFQYSDWDYSSVEMPKLKTDETLKALPSGFSPEEKKQIVEMMNDAIFVDLFRDMSQLGNYPLSIYLSLKYPGQDEAISLKKIAEKSVIEIEEFASYLPDPLNKDVLRDKKNYELYLKGVDLSEQEVVGFVSDSIIHSLILKMLKEKEKYPKIFSWKGLSIDQIRKEFKLESTLNEMERYSQNFTLENAAYKAKKAAHLNAFASRYLAVAKLDKAALKKDTESFIDRVEGFLKTKLSQKTMGQISLRDQALILPENQSALVRSVENVINNEIEVYNDPNEFHQLAEEKQQKLAKLITVVNLLKWDENEDLSDLDSVFELLDAPLLSDASYNVGKGAINISPYSVYSTDHKPGIVLHELAHSFRYDLTQATMSKHSAEVFFKARACLSDRHSKKQTRSFTYKVDSEGKLSSKEELNDVHTEEDWADMIAALTLKKDEKNYACALVDQVDNKYMVPNLLEDDSGDVHSSSIFRLLHVETLKSGKLPESCNTALKDSGAKLNFQSCI